LKIDGIGGVWKERWTELRGFVPSEQKIWADRIAIGTDFGQSGERISSDNPSGAGNIYNLTMPGIYATRNLGKHSKMGDYLFHMIFEN